MKYPKGLSAIYHPSPIVTVHLPRCRDSFALSFSAEGEHYFVEQLRQYQSNPQITYTDSFLKNYYDHHQPHTLEEALFLEPLESLNHESEEWPALPWIRKALPRASYVQHFGPTPQSSGEYHFRNLISIYRSLKKEGYRPHHYRDGFIRGYFLKNGNDYRFIVTGGQHRMAALTVLGYKTILVKLQPGFPRAVDIRSIMTWPGVRKGVYNPSDARKVFEHFFRPD